MGVRIRTSIKEGYGDAQHRALVRAPTRAHGAVEKETDNVKFGQLRRTKPPYSVL